jgi:HSP20 family protein
MNELMEWKPFREVSRLRREMDRLFEDFFGPGRRALRPLEMEWAPAVDVEETADQVTVKAEIPGITPKDIDISLSGDVLTLKGEKKAEREEKGKNYHLVERSYGSFSRSLRLPAAVDADKIDATYKDGVLTVTCPKKEKVKPKVIEVKAK